MAASNMAALICLLHSQRMRLAGKITKTPTRLWYALHAPTCPDASWRLREKLQLESRLVSKGCHCLNFSALSRQRTRLTTSPCRTVVMSQRPAMFFFLCCLSHLHFLHILKRCQTLTLLSPRTPKRPTLSPTVHTLILHFTHPDFPSTITTRLSRRTPKRRTRSRSTTTASPTASSRSAGECLHDWQRCRSCSSPPRSSSPCGAKLLLCHPYHPPRVTCPSCTQQQQLLTHPFLSHSWPLSHHTQSQPNAECPLFCPAAFETLVRDCCRR